MAREATLLREPALARSARTGCCIVGGGPAGMMLGYLLARGGIEVVVIEKHGDFLRDFRGDTIHPSTLDVVGELGLLEGLLARPHQEVSELAVRFGEQAYPIADFRHLPTVKRFIAMMPQWDFLDFLAGEARTFPNFRLELRTEAKGLIEESGRIAGVTAQSPDGPVEIRSVLTIGADGRHSTLRAAAGLPVEDQGAPFDVLWLRLTRRPSDRAETMGVVGSGHMFVQINRGEYWQCAFVIHKGGLEDLKAKGLEDFRAQIASLVPDLADRVATDLADWDKVKLLTVTVDRLTTWHRPGLLCIGDAAHAMSPIGGVGITLAIQDAVAAANILAPSLLRGEVTEADLAAVQRRRAFPTGATQRLQVLAQDRILRRVLNRTGPVAAPVLIRMLARFPLLRRLPARLIGMGFRPEHVRVAAVAPAETG